VPVVLDVDLDRRLPATHEAALYFVAAEALTNVAKYAQGTTVRARVPIADSNGSSPLA
jgi:signal transduction histidine kinase